jgi:metal-responsive CopG/Arc/MetJ family transcriptional regulator
VTLDPDTLREIDQAASKERLTRSEWVRQRLEWSLEDSHDHA